MKERLGSLRARLVAYVFFIMAAASLFTGGLYIVLFHLGVIRPFLITRVMSPVYLVCISGLVGTLISAWVGKYYVSPITQVIAATSRVARGDFSVYLPEEGSGELSELIHSFNRMTSELSGIEMFRTDFINNFSHEFKTPIVSIRGFARQLLRDDLTDAQRREYATIIAGEAERLANLASNILLLSKLENQQIVTEKTSFRLDEQVRSCILLLEKQWTGKNLNLSIDLEEITCHANAEMLSQACLNLLSNAVKFTPTGGDISVSLHRIGQEAELTVRDNGIGMDADTQKHIFEKFYQGEPSHHAEGNGLGLAMVRRIVELSAGRIHVQSAPCQGSVFTVTLPLEEN